MWICWCSLCIMLSTCIILYDKKEPSKKNINILYFNRGKILLSEYVWYLNKILFIFSWKKEMLRNSATKKILFIIYLISLLGKEIFSNYFMFFKLTGCRKFLFLLKILFYYIVQKYSNHLYKYRIFLIDCVFNLPVADVNYDRRK